MGLSAYRERQLHPERIDESAAEQLLADMEALKISPSQLLAAYPPPALLRQIDRRPVVPAGMDQEANPNSLFPAEITSSG